MSTAEKAQTIADLRAMAALIKRNGLAKGEFVLNVDGKDEKDCPVCSLGAIGLVTWGDPYSGDEVVDNFTAKEIEEREGRFTAARNALAAYVCIERYNVAKWNDADERTQDEVIAAFNAAADALEAS